MEKKEACSGIKASLFAAVVDGGSGVTSTIPGTRII